MEYPFDPKKGCTGIFAFCIIIHLIVGLYGSVQVVWYPISYGFLMTIIYAACIVCVFLRLKTLYIVLVVVEAILLFLLFLFWGLAIYTAAVQPKEGVDILYNLFPQDGNYIETYKTLSIALVISSLILLIVNALGLVSTVYGLLYIKEHEDNLKF